MILADKIIELRKKNGWSQEELAEKLEVSRQAISKWESARTTPDLNRIIAMSELFRVSVDDLIKEQRDVIAIPEPKEEKDAGWQKVSLAEAGDYLQAKKKRATLDALCVMLCILAGLPTILAGMWKDQTVQSYGDSGTIFLLAVAVALSLWNHYSTKKFQWIDDGRYDTAYGVRGLAQKESDAFSKTYVISIIIGMILCIVSLIPFTFSDGLESVLALPEEVFQSMGIVLIAIGVFLFVRVGTCQAGYERMMQEGEYTMEKRKRKKRWERKTLRVTGIYWLTVSAVFFGYGFITLDWGKSWIIWPMALILYGIVYVVLRGMQERADEKTHPSND